VKVVGPLPQGFPPFTIPRVRLADLALLFGGAVGIALVALADTISTATSFAARSGDRVDGNREMIGVGAANVAAGLFQGFPVSSSGSRTAVAEQAGAKTQMAGVIGAVGITLILLLVPGLLKDLPQPTLAAVVICAALTLADMKATRRLFRQRRTEFGLAVAAFLAVVLLGVLPGILVAVGLSIGNVFRHAWWPYHTVLGRVPGIPGFHDVTSYPHAELLRGCVIVRFDGPLFFANARAFREQIEDLLDDDPPPSWIIVAAEPITDVDTTAADMLTELEHDLNGRGVNLVFAEMKDPVRRKVDRYDLTSKIDPANFFPTLKSATEAYRAATGVEWAAPPNAPRPTGGADVPDPTP
jgi:MFS superfamily sulfate permease-like transporter